MILTELRDYIIAHPKCTLHQLAKAFRLTEDGIQAMLGVWQKKGQLKIVVSTQGNKQMYRYTWVSTNELAIRLYC